MLRAARRAASYYAATLCVARPTPASLTPRASRSYYRERLELQRQDEEQAQRARTAFDACDGNRDGLLKQARPKP